MTPGPRPLEDTVPLVSVSRLRAGPPPGEGTEEVQVVKGQSKEVTPRKVSETTGDVPTPIQPLH